MAAWCSSGRSTKPPIGPLGHADGRPDGGRRVDRATLARETAEEAGLDLPI
jgi:hypothetical protein